jgi:DNA-directed RNA polymerase specialized sigma24 family protein
MLAKQKSPSDLRAEPGLHAGDLALAQRIAEGNAESWNSFLSDYNRHIEETAIRWCHRRIPGRVCKKCRPRISDADSGCDTFGDAYVYILDRIRNTALAAYGGRTALGSFVYLCLHDYRWWASFVQKETGKIKLPKALEDEPKPFQQIYFRLCWGWESDRIASGLHLSIEEVEATREKIEAKLREAGRSMPAGKLKPVSLSAVFSDEEETPRADEPQSPTVDLEIRSEAVRYWATLSVADRTLLRLVVESGRSTAEIAQALGLSAQQVYSAIHRVRREMPDWFKMQPGKIKSSPGSVQIITEGEEE